jgi:hypothetical protein
MKLSRKFAVLFKNHQMNKIILAIACFFMAAISSTHAQLVSKTECGVVTVDVYKGWINELKPNADPERMKVKIPCFTSFEPEGSESKCGGGIYYADKGLIIYTQRDYFEIGEKMKGKLTIPLLGAKRDAMFAWFGNPKIKDANWEAYQMSYGTLVVYFNAKNLVNKVIISTKGADELQLCQ